MDMEHEIPKKLGVLATHGDGEPPKTLDARYVKNINHYFDNPEKTPFNLIMGVTLDQREYFRDYRLTQKGKLLWDQIYILKWYARQVCLSYDYTCCSRMKAPHLPFSCKFNDNETLASYANGIYDYYDVEQIEEFVAFMGAVLSCSLSLVMDMEHEIPKKLGLLTTHGDGEPPQTLDAHYVKNIMHYFNNPEKTPFNYIMGDTLDQREYFRDYRLTQKGKLLWDQIDCLQWYA